MPNHTIRLYGIKNINVGAIMKTDSMINDIKVEDPVAHPNKMNKLIVVIANIIKNA